MGIVELKKKLFSYFLKPIELSLDLDFEISDKEVMDQLNYGRDEVRDARLARMKQIPYAELESNLSEKIYKVFTS